ncbi:hypothetical protein FQR65_LT01847 [Abscondita terminalis]|nr:hypothetical protein FQR65_LT01847 [Abscondita terminalis]
MCFLNLPNLNQTLSYWKVRKVPHKKPWPLIGNVLPLLLKEKSNTELLEDLYNSFPNQKYFGFYSFRNPQLIIKDLDLIKQITIKDFDHFMDRTVQISEDVEPLFAKNLGSLSGQKWKDMRSTLSPTFTSSKMKFLFNLISDCAQQFTKYFEDEKFDMLEVDTKDIATRFTNDAIATSAFGISLNSLKEKTNEFYLIGKDFSTFGGLRGLKLLGYTVFPALMRFLKVSVFPKSHANFFKNIIENNIRDREERGLIRPDLIHILLQARKEQLIKEESNELETGFAVAQGDTIQKINSKHAVELSDLDITAQGVIFFFAGFETTSTLICFMAHELAINSDVQQKLQKEIDEVLERVDGKISYDSVLGMKYLDMVVSESLRKWTPGIIMERICVKDYILESENSDEPPLFVEKGLSVVVPVYAIHHDPKYFPNPKKFDPERFSDENKHNIKPFSYMPFGIGPRNCIASRFAIMETKILFFHLLSKFDLVVSEKTTVPLEFTRKQFLLAPDGGFWIGLKPRK